MVEREHFLSILPKKSRQGMSFENSCICPNLVKVKLCHFVNGESIVLNRFI